MSDLDLVIIGADDAEKKKHGRAKSFYVACADAVADGESLFFFDDMYVATLKLLTLILLMYLCQFHSTS